MSSVSTSQPGWGTAAQVAKHAPAHLAYRRDIDGLRALAVLLVVVFHAFPKSMGGGYIGVDVFFVISGYLISGLIFERLQAGSFSIIDFYVRRVRRIFPALLLVMLATMVVGWLVLLSDEFGKLGKHVVAGATFVSNIVLWREAGYFDDDAALKPLLHLWSLGVEEQFYFVWPLLLAVLWGVRRHMLAAIAVMAAISFAANVFFVGSMPTAVFFLPLTRFWELMLGAGLAYAALTGKPAISDGRIREVAAPLGVAMIAAAAALMDKSSRFPGYWALLPSLGAVLVIAAGPSAWLNRTLFSHRAVVYVGLISYPLYLWHWPLLSIARLVNAGAPLAPAVAGGLMLLAVLMASLTYRFVEKPIRDLRESRAVSRSAALLVGAMVLVAILAASIATGRLKPLSSRYAPMEEVAAASKDYGYGDDRSWTGTAAGKAIFIGDSHMQHYGPRVDALQADRSLRTRSVVFLTEGGCAPVPRIERSGRRCNLFVTKAMEAARAPDVDTVVIAGSWAGFMERGDYRAAEGGAGLLDLTSPAAAWVFDGWAADLRALVASGKRVVLVMASPRADGFAPKHMVRRGLGTFAFEPVPLARADLARQWPFIAARLRQVARDSGAIVVDPLDHFCDDTRCQTTFEANRPISTDGSHLRAAYVARYVTYLDPFILADR